MLRSPIFALALLLAVPVVSSAEPAVKSKAIRPSFRTEFLANLDEVQGKLLKLAEATPPERYAWRPAEAADIRSVSEVYMHIAGGNYFLSTFLGARPPANLAADLEKTVTSRKEVVDHLRRSFLHVRSSVARLSDADFDKAVKMFGSQTTYRGVMITMLSHLHEHLGQSIAYARIIGIVPPWSRPGD